MLHRAMHRVRKTPKSQQHDQLICCSPILLSKRLDVKQYTMLNSVLNYTWRRLIQEEEAVFKFGLKMNINCVPPSQGGMSDLVKISRSSSSYRLVSLSIIKIMTQMYSLDYSHKSNLNFNMLDFMLDSKWVSFFYIFWVTGHLIKYFGCSLIKQAGNKSLTL